MSVVTGLDGEMAGGTGGPNGIHVLRRSAQGLLVGAGVGTLEHAFSQLLRGYPLPGGFWLSFTLTTAVLVGAGWLAAELAAACLPRRWRAANRGLLFGALTLAGLIAAHLLYFGGLHLRQPRFHVALLALLAAAYGAARLGAAVKRSASPRALLAVSAGVLVSIVAVAFMARNGAPAEPAAATGRTNVLVILVDTLRVDRMSLYGGPRPTTPFLDALAKEAFLFRRAYTPSAWTGPSVASIFTGLKSTEHGLYRDPFVNRGHTKMLPEHFAAHGYDTFGAVGTAIIGPLHGFHRGFRTFHAPVGNAFFRTRIGYLIARAVDRLDLSSVRGAFVRIQDAFLPGGESLYGLTASRIVSSFDDFLGTRPGPFFAYLHFFEPHAPYDAPAPFRGRYEQGPLAPDETFPVTNMGFRPQMAVRDEPRERIERYERLYDEEVLATDAAIAAVVESLRASRRLDDTLIVLVSDHGEEFFDRGGWSHGHQCFEEIVRGLMMIRFPEGTPSGSSDVPVSLRSANRLITDRASLPPLSAAVEPVLERLASGGASGSRDPKVLVELHRVVPGHVPAFAVIDGPWKLVRHGEAGQEVEWLFHLDRDPTERADVSAAHPEIRAALARWLDEEIRAPILPPEDPRPELLDPLRALGYVG